VKSVLVISYYFPPSGGPGVQRVLKFVKYLPEFGWRPVVLTVENGDYPARDESLLAEIPKHAMVYRTRIPEPYRLYRRLTGRPPDSPVDVENIPKGSSKRPLADRVAEFIRSTFFIPDARIGWFPFAVAKGREVIHREGIQALYSSSPPYTSSLIARALHRKSRLPWIAGFRDPWTGFLSTPKRWALPHMVDKHLERSVLEEASGIEIAWQGIQHDALRKFPALDRSKFRHLPNGFDRADFPDIPPQPNERFTVTYAGSMYGKRNPASFFTALEELIREGSINPARIQLRFVGRFGSEVQEIFRKASFHASIKVMPYRPHSESIAELVKADALLLVVDEVDGSEGIVPGKIFEYIGAGRPIIALAPPGAVADLIAETGSGYVAANRDIQAIKHAFRECYGKFGYHRRQFRQNEDAVRKYERREVTRRLAELLDRVVRPGT
jgi:glycosyltransferase involved in cell wall biosynthesis